MKVADFLLVNDGHGKFANVSSLAGSALRRIESGRGAGFDDLDNDGDVDLVVINFNSLPTVGRTQSLNENRSLSLRLVGTRSNRDACGSKVEVRNASGKVQKQVSCGGRGYESYYGGRLYFGCGTAEAVMAEVLWPNGIREEFAIKNPTMTLVEGRGRIVEDSN